MSKPQEMPTEPENAGSDGAPWLSVADVAARLGISDRAVQKRCASGKIVARRVVTPQGTKWEIDPNQWERTNEPNERTSEPKEGEPANSLPELASFHAQNEANGRTRTDETQHEPANERDANGRTSNSHAAPLFNDVYAALLTEKDARIEDLRATVEEQRAQLAAKDAQIEQANRSVAEWRQQAREAQRMASLALPVGKSADSAESAQSAKNGAQNLEAAKESPDASGAQIGQVAPERRGFWQRLKEWGKAPS